MGKVFPTGPLQIACYMGAAANLVLMVVLLVGKFVWFRPGAHEVASWIVTGVELLVAILNMILAYQLASGNRANWLSSGVVLPRAHFAGLLNGRGDCVDYDLIGTA